MKKLIVLIPFLFLLVFTNFSENKGGPDRGGPDRQNDKMSMIKDKLEIIETKYIAVLSSRERREAIKTMDEVMGLLEDLGREENRPKNVRPMSDQDFKQLLKRLDKNVGYNDKKCELFKTSINNNYTVDQLVQILNIFKFDDDRIDVAFGLYPIIIDKKNINKIYPTLTFEKARQKLREMIDSYDRQNP
jgi:hypothetical protein